MGGGWSGDVRREAGVANVSKYGKNCDGKGGVDILWRF